MSGDGVIGPTVVLGGRYELGRVIGQGGMAVVHEGRDRRLERPVAVKLLRQELAHQLTVRRRFESEARLAARLAHPNVVSVFDSGDEGGLAFIVMERLSGRSLQEEMAGGPMAVEAVYPLVAQMLAALTAAHGAGIVHRDLKPGNILAGPAGEWKLGDFGIAKAAELPSADHTATGLLIGTPAYLAPERFFGEEATVESDLYALGVVMYEAIAGRKPYEMAASQQWAASAAGAAPAPIRALRPDIDPGLAEAIDRCLLHQPEQRFGSAAEMAAAISGPEPWPHRLIASAWTPRPDPTDVLPTLERPGGSGRQRRFAAPRRTRLLGAIAAGAALVVVAAVVILSAVSHPGRSSYGPSGPPTTTPATGHLPAGLDHALRRLANEVQH